mmetsp:Transcript_93962/g.162666  ORF Transcript_93962/g.162666 Transcript_93962/m.162666 type:complete len:432 (-) Transcript_93962:45-1340(-)
MLLHLVTLHAIWPCAFGTTSNLKTCVDNDSIENAIGDEGDETHLLQVRSNTLGRDFGPLEPHSGIVAEIWQRELPYRPQLTLAIYQQAWGSGGMGSIRQELINAMLVSRAMNRTLVLDDDLPQNVPLRSVYDIPLMRSRQLQDLGTTFLWLSEVKKAGVEINMSKCSWLRIPKRTTLSQGLDDLQQLTITDSANVGIAPDVCVLLGNLDGNSGWSEDTSQCEERADCVALFRSFQLHPAVEEHLKLIKAKLDLRGQNYTCFHANPAYNCHFLNGTAWKTCMSQLTKTMLYNTTLFASTASILVVGQRDVDVVPILEHYLEGLGMKRSLFTLVDLGFPALSKGHYWYDPLYAQRGAVSWGLCSPRYAQAYVGEQYSGFTYGLLADALINPQSRGNWSMMFGSGSFEDVPMNYLDQLAELGKAVPSWIIQPPP